MGLRPCRVGIVDAVSIRVGNVAGATAVQPVSRLHTGNASLLR